MRVLVTGGAGFVGANLSIALAERHPDWELVALDNLHRRGSELNLPRLREAGVEFAHGDVREPADLEERGALDAIVECSAEPSVLAGLDFGPTTSSARTSSARTTASSWRASTAPSSSSSRRAASTPSSSRTRSTYVESETRFELEPEQPVEGVGARRDLRAFPLDGARTLYGATKLAAELLIAEYADAFGLRTVVDRCGVIAGPWQMGKVDQGVFTHWMLSHYFGRDLTYIGYGGAGKQVRDLISRRRRRRPGRRPTARRPTTGPASWQRRRRPRDAASRCSRRPTSCRELTGTTDEIGDQRGDRPGRRPDLPLGLRAALPRTPTGGRARSAAILEDIPRWVSDRTSAPSSARWVTADMS